MASDDSWESSYSESLEASSILSKNEEKSCFDTSNEDKSHINASVEESSSDQSLSPNTSSNRENGKTDNSFSDSSYIGPVRRNKPIYFSTSEDEDDNVSSLNDVEIRRNTANELDNVSKNNSNGNESLNNESRPINKSNDGDVTDSRDSSPDENLRQSVKRTSHFSNTLDESVENTDIVSKMNDVSIVDDSDTEEATAMVNSEDNTKLTDASPRIINSSTSSESHEKDQDIIDVSTDEEASVFIPKRQVTLPEVLKKRNDGKVNTQTPIAKAKLTQNSNALQESNGDNVIIVSQAEYDKQLSTVTSLREDHCKMKNMLHTINLDALPDKGQLLRNKHEALGNALKVAQTKLDRMEVNKDLKTETSNQPKLVAWEDLQAMSEAVQPKSFGQQAMATINAQKTLTMEHLQQIHTSLATRPSEDTHAESPKGLLVELMPHQKYALAWLLWREAQRPSGGILADDMGLGKTLTMISLVLKSREIKQSLDNDDSDEENRVQRSSKHPGGTLVVCPASLLRQWESEVEKHCKKYLLSVELYHGPKRETKPKILAKRDMVITTYSICMNEVEKGTPLYQIKWRRVILDEAHQVRNYKSQTSVAVCRLSAQSRWALTGTPVHNKEEDMFALLKFLRCAPLDDLAMWKRWVANKRTGGQDRLNTILASTMLRRTKASLQEQGTLTSLPARTHETIDVTLQAQERAVYEKILVFSRTLFAQYLHQHAEKEKNYMALGEYSKLSRNPNSAYFQMHQKMVKLNKVKEVKSHEILVLLLRLRQMCCHPSLILKMLHADQLDSVDDIEGQEEMNLLEEMKQMNINDVGDEASSSRQPENNEDDDRSLKDLLNPNSPLFSEHRRSTKMEAVLKLLIEKILPSDEKAIVVSQWTGLLRLLGLYLKESGIPFCQLDGSIPVIKRMPIIDNFNSPRHPMKVLLLSLTAGGVGLNLTGGNHMLLLDLHWNPQLEMQAQDRIYRVGQRREVHIYKFMALNTIEERINKLQEIKLSMADSMLTGSKAQQAKLTLQDLKMLFNM